MRISPLLICSSPAIMRSSVDLPQPDGPTSTVNEPSGMSMSTPCSTAVSPKFFLTAWIVTLAMHAGPGFADEAAGAVSAPATGSAIRANR